MNAINEKNLITTRARMLQILKKITFINKKYYSHWLL